MLRAARAVAEAQRQPLGRVVSELVRRGLSAELPERERNGFPVFPVAEDARPIAPEDVARDEDRA